MRPRATSAAGIATTALVLTSVATGAVTASGSAASHVSLRASGLASLHGSAATAKPMGVSPAGACQTSFGKELPTVDGIIAWNDDSGTTFDTAGAADVMCLHSRKIATVKAYGYFGTAPTDTFHVTFYANDPENGSNEADDNNVLCDYPNLTGAAGGEYPKHVKTVLTLKPACKLPAGQNWVAIQNVDSSQPWYWEMQDTSAGGASPDWVDRHDWFESGCTTLDNDRYLVDCLGYVYADWMLVLRGAHHP
jgi:hypothetical protein